MLLAISEAEKYLGATSPNPPVGACLVHNGKVVSIGAHAKAGSPHAEKIAIDRALLLYGKEFVKNCILYVTLEPCNHTGKTPPCTNAIIEAGIKKVRIGSIDPNQNVKGGGVSFLKNAGIEVITDIQKDLCDHLIAPFRKWIKTGVPWISHKIAYRVTHEGELSMIPDSGKNTFTSAHSLKEAHLERRRSDAILTGLGTVLKDFPKFNVRHVTDHENRRRFLVVASKSGEAPPQHWIEQEWDLGFEVLVSSNIQEMLKQLGEMGVHRVLVEAGPDLSKYFIENELWDERLIFLQNLPQKEDIKDSAISSMTTFVGKQDYILREYRDGSGKQFRVE